MGSDVVRYCILRALGHILRSMGYQEHIYCGSDSQNRGSAPVSSSSAPSASGSGAPYASRASSQSPQRIVMDYRGNAAVSGRPKTPAPGSPADKVARSARGACGPASAGAQSAGSRSTAASASGPQRVSASRTAAPASERARFDSTTTSRASRRIGRPKNNLGYVEENGGRHRWTNTSYTQPKDFQRRRKAFFVVLGVVLSVVLVLCGVVFANSCSSAEPTKSGGSVAYAVSADSQPTLLADLTSMAEMGVLSAISQELSALERAGTEQV